MNSFIKRRTVLSPRPGMAYMHDFDFLWGT